MRLFKNKDEGINEISEDEKQKEIEELENELRMAKEGKAAKPIPREQKESRHDEVKYIEREITLSLLNEKLNYLIAQLERMEAMLK